MIRLNDILERVHGYRPEADLDLIKKAYVYSAKVHQGQIRKSGEPYLIHPLEVAGILAELKLDESSIVAGMLHDTIEDTLAKPAEIKELFGQEVLDLVEGVTKLSAIPVPNATHEEKQAENLRKMLVAMAKDIRVILVKLADRTHNMRTLEHMKPESQRRIAQETLDIYAPLAHRLGIQWVKIELEDLAFKYLKPQEYAQVEKELAVSQKDRNKFIAEVVELLQGKLKEANIVGDVQGRPKHLYSIWKKADGQHVSVNDLHDIVAFRLILKSVPACYEALGLIHSLWKPIPGRFKDYIAIPKPNGYQSLHTTVIGPSGERIEIQMRTEEMHRIAEEGIAAHWSYKEGKSNKDDQKFAWLRQLIEWQQDLKDSREFLETVKVDLFTDEVFVFTPAGEVKSLPFGSTPIDFAYAVHSEVGSHCVGAKVNGKMVPLRTKLKNGDTIEVLTSTNAKPNKDWLSFVKTSRAQARIRAYIKGQQREKSIELGKGLLEREFKKFDINFSKFVKSDEFLKAAQDMGHARADDLVSAVGYGKLTPLNILNKVLGPEKLAEKKAADEEKGPEPAASGNRLTELFKRVAQRTRTSGGVRIGGIDDVLVRYAKCCGPVPGDPIVGFITRGRGVTVHVRGCTKAMESDPERKVDVSWDVQGEFKRVVSLRVKSDDRKGLLAKMSETFADMGVNIVHADARSTADKLGALSSFDIEIKDAKQLNEVVRAIGAIAGVHSVERA
ncbi:MAG: bifunctional (p)ppGpp synthetase/guanosine-3',5'-bis(diphosphate) 3'-pyrophosphohydrolase [Deltaproteobacteria bacterium]|nr:bifunctional (p)ppGpp synthetase/guanosine-3',5'-bis(diphosphate) 3'-pyrophosphohydrolase [Deltaproteobacteria bacterium]